MPRLYDHILLCLFVGILCGPVIWVFSAGLRADIPTAIQRLDTIGPGLTAMVVTTLSLAIGTSVLSTALSFLTAFAIVFCRMRFGWLWFWLSVATLYFPIESRMLQTFDVTSALGLTNSMTGLLLPTLQVALGTLFFRQHFKNLPPEILEAARLDGAGPVRFIKDFAVALSITPICVVALVTFILGWNQYLWPLMVSLDDRHWTLVRALEQVRAGSPQGLVLAGLAMLPPLALILVFQKHLSRLGHVRA